MAEVDGSSQQPGRRPRKSEKGAENQEMKAAALGTAAGADRSQQQLQVGLSNSNMMPALDRGLSSAISMFSMSMPDSQTEQSRKLQSGILSVDGDARQPESPRWRTQEPEMAEKCTNAL